MKEAVQSVLGKDSEVYIFGSRTNLTKKGGDIDILVISKSLTSEKEKFEAKIKILKNLYKRLGERKIDLIITNKPEKRYWKNCYSKGN